MRLESNIAAGLLSVVGLVGLGSGGTAAAQAVVPLQALPTLPTLRIDLKETTVSGISSGAYMAVQMGVAHSSQVRGVAATAGGPYLCATDGDVGSAVAAVSRCMQGDPLAQPAATERLVDPSDGRFTYGFQGKARRDVERMARAGRIDPIANLSRQAIWIFHGYNDGIVKLPVSQALEGWYTGRHPDGRAASGMTARLPASQVFHKDDLSAGHAQISSACTGALCNPCEQQGGSFINSCPLPEGPYDAAGSALQMFYGPLERAESARLAGRLLSVRQTPFLKLIDGRTAVGAAADIAMDDEAFLYLPRDCEAGGTATCRLHIAFHGCMQSAVDLAKVTGQRDYFARHAGLNEWADRNRIVVLYPQATPSRLLPYNPMGCWDWWGYNDDVPARALSGTWPSGSFASRQGVQIAAVWRMAEQLADVRLRGSLARVGEVAGEQPPAPVLLDRSATQVLLRWAPVAGARAYKVSRSSGSRDATSGSGTTTMLQSTQPFFVDRGLTPQKIYRYTVSAVLAGRDGPVSAPVQAVTGPLPPACDPYFSLTQNRVVDRSNRPTERTCR
ncbi:MAG: hypothetical protein RL654_1046 [Pseudomonadota bacterium]|jgi:poly(3-hydroxybutyrate) depolymerase